ncbi:LXG domain-containing protein [Psychrobacillus sp. FSL W7-1457]|uniref:ribonuclease YeeF family protein n=1 Tax=Psychrobacillus sp. FSL W7-1457 TaxID=2954547 RepID=UPI00315AC410
MKVLDVDLLQTGIKNNVDMLSRLEEEMKVIETSITGLVELDHSLTGEGGAAIRSFYNDCHLPFHKYFLEFNQNFKIKLNQIKSALDSLEPDYAGHIQESFLEGEVEEGLVVISNTTSNLTEESNAIIDGVADIVALPHLDDSEVQQGVTDSRKKKDVTVENLHEFDTTQTSALVAVESTLNALNKWLMEIEGMMSAGLTDTHFPAKAWAEFTACTPILSELSGNVNDPGSVADKDASGEAGKVSEDNRFDQVNDSLGYYGNATTIVKDAESGFLMWMATRNGELSSDLRFYVPQKGGTSYRIYASPLAMGVLGFPNQSGGMLKYAGKKQGQSGWSPQGEMVLEKHPHLRYWGENTTFAEKGKTIGSATLRGTAEGFKDVFDLRGIAQNGLVKGATRAVAPITAGLSYYDNYSTAKENGSSEGAAHARAVGETAADVAIGSAIQVGLTAAGTALIPIPGLGTFLGAAAGVGVNMLLNAKGKDDESVMDKLKGLFR